MRAVCLAVVIMLYTCVASHAFMGPGEWPWVDHDSVAKPQVSLEWSWRHCVDPIPGSELRRATGESEIICIDGATGRQYRVKDGGDCLPGGRPVSTD